MAFEEYFVKDSIESWKSSVIISNRCLKLGEDFWCNSLGKCERVRLFFNRDTNEVGILPVKQGETLGLKVLLTRERNPTVRWAGFVKKFHLFFDDSQFCLVKNSKSGEMMKVVELKIKEKVKNNDGSEDKEINL